jgi:hypothetical protein
MRHYTKIILLGYLLAALGCKKEHEQWREKYVQCQDSLYKIPIDSFFDYDKDNTHPILKDGYYKMYHENLKNYGIGKINNQNKIGLWKNYSGEILLREENYNSKGQLHGYLKNCYGNKEISSIYHYVNDEQVGMQKEYYSNQTLETVYTLAPDHSYRDKLIHYDQKGKVVYEEDFGKEGTGYYKQFSYSKKVIAEGAYLKGKKIGMHYEHLIGLEDVMLATEQNFYNNNGGLERVKKIRYEKNKEYDSLIFIYTKNKTQLITYNNGKIIENKKYNDTLL